MSRNNVFLRCFYFRDFSPIIPVSFLCLGPHLLVDRLPLIVLYLTMRKTAPGNIPDLFRHFCHTRRAISQGRRIYIESTLVVGALGVHAACCSWSSRTLQVQIPPRRG